MKQRLSTKVIDRTRPIIFSTPHGGTRYVELKHVESVAPCFGCCLGQVGDLESMATQQQYAASMTTSEALRFDHSDTQQQSEDFCCTSHISYHARPALFSIALNDLSYPETSPGPRADRQIATNARRCSVALHRAPAVQQGQGLSGWGAHPRCPGDTRYRQASQ